MFSRLEEKRYKQLEANLRQDIIAKREKLQGPDPKPLVTTDDANVQPLLAFFAEKFCWEPGEYEVTLDVEVEPKKASLSKRYRITLFESDTKELEDYRDDYKYGFGINIDYPKHVGVGVPLTEA